MKPSRKVQQIRKNPVVGISIWSVVEFSDHYIVSHGKVEIILRKAVISPDIFAVSPESINLGYLFFGL